MSLIAGDLIDEARDYHASFGPKVITEKMALRALSSAERYIFREVTKLSESALASVVVIPVGDVTDALDAGTGIDIGEVGTLLDASVGLVVGTTRFPLTITSYANRFDVEFFPAAWIQGTRLFPIDFREFYGQVSGWGDYTDIRINRVPEPPALTTIDDALLIPDMARDALVGNLVLFMAQRANVLTSVPGMAERANGSMTSVIETIASTGLAGLWRVLNTD